MFLYELEIRTYITHTVPLCKLEKDTPSRQTNFQTKPLPSPSLIQATGLGQRNLGRISACIYATAGGPCVVHSPGKPMWWPMGQFWFHSFKSQRSDLYNSFIQEFSNYLVTATLFPLQFLISGSLNYSCLQMFSNLFTSLLALFGTCFCLSTFFFKYTIKQTQQHSRFVSPKRSGVGF